MPAPPFVPNARQTRALEAVRTAAENLARLENELRAARERLAQRQDRALEIGCARVAIANATGISTERYRQQRRERGHAA